ncbi:hypothetical protein B7494_g176 [Chlorociboria aeruginascens]|nr:hypothetical protein B7494_g176 [Chlorociboria aeruginascens]
MGGFPDISRPRPRRHSFSIPRPKYDEHTGKLEYPAVMAWPRRAPARPRKYHKEEEIFEISNDPGGYDNIARQYDKQKERKRHQPKFDISLVTVHHHLSKLAPPLEAGRDPNKNLSRSHIKDSNRKRKYSTIRKARLAALAKGTLHKSSPGDGAVRTVHDEDHEMLEASTPSSKAKPINTNMAKCSLKPRFSLDVLGLEDPFLANAHPATNATARFQNRMANSSNLDSFNQTIRGSQSNELVNNTTRNTTQRHHQFEKLSQVVDSAAQLPTAAGLLQNNLQSRQGASEEDILTKVLQVESQDGTSDKALLIKAGRALLQSRFHSKDDSFPDRRAAMSALKRLVKNPDEIEKWLNHKVRKAREEQHGYKDPSPKNYLGYDPWVPNLSDSDEKKEAERCAEIAVGFFDSVVMQPLEEDFLVKNRQWRDDYAFFMARETFDAEWERENAASFFEDAEEQPQPHTGFNVELDIDAEWAKMEENQKGESMPEQVVLPELKEISMDSLISTEDAIGSDDSEMPMDIDNEDSSLIEVVNQSSDSKDSTVSIPSFQTPNLDILNDKHPAKRIKLSTETNPRSLAANNTILQTQAQPILMPSKPMVLHPMDTSANSSSSLKAADKGVEDTPDVDSEDEVSIVRTSPILRPDRPEEKSAIKKDIGKSSSFQDKSNKNIFGRVESRNRSHKNSPTPGSTWNWGAPSRIAPRPSIPENAPALANNGHKPGPPCHNRRHSGQIVMGSHSPSSARNPGIQSFAKNPGSFQHTQGFIPNQGRGYNAPYSPGNLLYQYSGNNYQNQPSPQRRHMRHSSMDSARGGSYHQPQTPMETPLMGPMPIPRNPRSANRDHKRNTSLGSQYSSPGAMQGSPEFTYQGSPTPLPGPRTGNHNFTPLPAPSLATVWPVKFHMRSSPANSLAREAVVATFDTVKGREEGTNDIDAAVKANPDYQCVKMVAEFDDASKSVTVTGPAGLNIRGFVARHCKNVKLTVKMV